MVAYTVVLNSVNGVGQFNTQKTYLFDWSVFQSGKYLVSFSYIGKDDILKGTKLPLLYAQLGGSKVYTTGTTIASHPFAFLGALRVGTLSNDGTTHLQAENQTNPPIFLDSRPSSQQFTVEIQDETGALFLDQGVPIGDINGYVLTLFFTLLE